MNREKVIETMKSLPDEFQTEELIDKLLFIEKVEKGLTDADSGRVMTIDSAKEKLKKKWEK